MAIQADGRAETTLRQYLYHRKDQAGLRREAAYLPNANLYLAHPLADDHHIDKSLNVLAELEAYPDHAHRPAPRRPPTQQPRPNGHHERSHP